MFVQSLRGDPFRVRFLATVYIHGACISLIIFLNNELSQHQKRKKKKEKHNLKSIFLD